MVMLKESNIARVLPLGNTTNDLAARMAESGIDASVLDIEKL